MKLLDNDIAGALILTGMFLAIIGAAEIWTRWRNPDPELTRKLVHISGGLVSVLFPFFISSIWIVIFMAVVFTIFFAGAAKMHLLQCISRVRRKSHGSEYFPIAIAAIFYISQGRLWLYITSILTLAVADSAAALIGTTYGRFHYKVGMEEVKSFEGSLFFWLIAFLSIELPLLLMTDLPKLTTILSAFIVATLLTGIEAVSIKGTDNIFVPIFNCYILLKITSKPVAEVLFQSISMVVIICTILLIIRLTKTFSVRDSIIFIIFSYAAWSLGSVDWSMPIFVAFIIYSLCRFCVKSDKPFIIETGALMRVVLVPMAVLAVANELSLYKVLYGPFLTAVVMALLISIWRYLRDSFFLPSFSRRSLILLLNFTVSPLIVLSAMFSQGDFPLLALIIIPVLGGIILFLYDSKLTSSCGVVAHVFGKKPTIVLMGISAAAYLTIQMSGIVGVWHPSF